MTPADVSDVGRPIVLIPLGSFEQHGPHLPPDTDTVIAAEICRRIVATTGRPIDNGRRCIVTPPLGIGASGEHRGFTATLSMGTDALAETLIEISRSGEWAEAIVFVNGHGGNAEAITRARAVVEHERRPVVFWSPRSPEDGDAHAGHVETSVMLAIDPRLVRLDRLEIGNVEPLVSLIESLRDEGVAGVSANGVLGDPTMANADEGSRILTAWVDDLCRVIDGLT